MGKKWKECHMTGRHNAMNKNAIILLLRYSDNHGVNTIQSHADVIEKHGFCWWAKLGKKQPRESYLNEFLSQESPKVLLYSTGKLFVCDCGGVLRERPDKNYPTYYDRDFFSLEQKPEVYFKLKSIKEIELAFLDDYVVRSSEKDVLYDLKKTISSYMFIQHKDAPRKPKPKPRVRKATIKLLSSRGCIYRIEGSCTNKRCINYNYECMHPEVCTKQKVK